MKDKLLAWAQKAWRDFLGFSAGQKAVTVVAVLALLIGGYFLATWKSEPAYAPLYSNLAATDASSIAGKLAGDKIPYKLANGGAEILVPADKVDEARLSISAAGLPNNGQTGYSLLDKEGVTTSQFQQQVDYQRAVEGELAKTIQSIQGVQAASVHLAIPQQDVYNDNTTKPTASVMLTLGPGVTIGASQVQSIVYLVSSSVPSLTAANISVSDSAGNVLAAPNGSGPTGVATASTQAQMTTSYENNLQSKLQALVDGSLGAGHGRVSVNALLDFDSSKTTSNRYVYDKNTPPVSETTTSEKYAGGAGGSGGGTLGTTDTVGSTSGKGGDYTKTSTTKDNALGTESKTTTTSPGAVKSQSVSVALDKSAKGLNVNAITQLVKTAAGIDAARGDQLTVQAVPFAATAPVAKAAKADGKASMMGYAKQGALAVLVLAVLIGTFLSSRKRRKNDGGSDDDGYEAPRPDRDGGLDVFDEPAAPRGSRGAAPTERLPMNTGVPSAKDSATVRRDRPDLTSAAERQPDDVASILTDWLSPKENPR